jgi:lysophospholipase L1-like esterase
MTARTERLRYVALGDSYTIGTAVDPSERWPNLLVEQLGGANGPLRLVANLGVNGFTSADVIRVELPRLADLEPGFASVLVGVNDVVQGVPEAVYRDNTARILDLLLERVGASRVVAISTPDYTVTPAGADYGDPVARAAAIRDVNATFASLAGKRGVALVDIHDLSLRAASDRSLVADDGLHPSGAQYALWVDRIAPVVRDLLAQPSSG